MNSFGLMITAGLLTTSQVDSGGLAIEFGGYL